MREVSRSALHLGRAGFLASVAAAGLFVCAAPVSADAEVSVGGTPEAVRVEARGSSTAEVLFALGAAFGVKFRTATTLDQPIAGTFKGPVLKVMSRLLTNYNYVVKETRAGRIEVIVFGSTGKDSDRVVSVYPDPSWRARSYARKFFHPEPRFGRAFPWSSP